MIKRIFAFTAILLININAVAQSENQHNGIGLAEAGKAVMYTGASFALTGAAIFTIGALTYECNPEYPTMPIYPILALGAGAVGAAVSLIGLPLYCIGSNIMYSQGASFLNIGDDLKPGKAGIVELGLGIPNFVSLDAIPGYNFNSHLFLGGGIGYKAYLTQGLVNDGGITASLPLYAHARYSPGNKQASPYAGLSAGFDVKNSSIYSGLEFGARIRNLKNRENGSSTWIGTKLDISGSDYLFISLKLGTSF